MKDDALLWDSIREEYVHSKLSYSELAKKRNVARASLQRMATKEKWPELREEYRANVMLKTTELGSEIEDVATTINRVAKKVLEAIETEMQREKDINPLDKKYATNFKNITGALIDIRDLLIDQSGKAQEVIVKLEDSFDRWSE